MFIIVFAFHLRNTSPFQGLEIVIELQNSLTLKGPNMPAQGNALRVKNNFKIPLF